MMNGRMKSTVKTPGFDEAQRRMEQAIVEAEKFHSAVETPPGRDISMHSSEYISKGSNVCEERCKNSQGNNKMMVGNGLTDDDFFHLTCHIDASLIQKIESGDYVDLDKLLPKDNNFPGKVSVSNETKLEWVQSEGNTYLVPAKSNSKINCFRHWEQAF